MENGVYLTLFLYISLLLNTKVQMRINYEINAISHESQILTHVFLLYFFSLFRLIVGVNVKVK